MSAGPVTSLCRNCGAPLELDDAGRCRWCHAPVRFESPGSRAGLVPHGLDDCFTSAPFIYLTLSAFNLLGTENAVRQFLAANPGLHDRIRALAVATSAAGVRVRDAGLLKDDFDDNLKVYTPEEIWTFNLAIDVVARLSVLDGLPPSTHAQMVNNLKSLDDRVRSHTWKKELKRAGDGPAEFRDLRAAMPPHA